MAIHIASGSTLRRDLSVVAQEYDAELAAQTFIADRVAPRLPVAVQAAEYPVWIRENFVKEDDVNRNNDGSYNRIDGGLGTLTFSCDEHGLEASLDDRKRKMYASFIDFETTMTRSLRHRILKARERRVASMVINASTYSAASASVNWDTAATGVPLTDIATGIAAIQLKTGIPGSMMSLVLSKADFDNCVSTTQVINKLQYTYGGGGGDNKGIIPHLIRPAQLAAICGIKEVHVGMGGYDTTEEGITPSMSAIWTAGYAMLAVLGTPGGGLDTFGAWHTFDWTADSSDMPVVERYRDETRRADIVRVRDDADEVATAEADLLNYLIDTST